MGLVVLLGGCSQLEKYTNVGSNATAQEKFRACAFLSFKHSS